MTGSEFLVWGLYNLWLWFTCLIFYQRCESSYRTFFYERNIYISFFCLDYTALHSSKSKYHLTSSLLVLRINIVNRKETVLCECVQCDSISVICVFVLVTPEHKNKLKTSSGNMTRKPCINSSLI